MMRRRVRLLSLAAVVAIATPACAQDAAAGPPAADPTAAPGQGGADGVDGGVDRDGDKLRSCFSRPTLVDSACLVNPGHVFFEAGLADFTHDDTSDSRTDELDSGVFTFRAGLTEHSELTVDWTAFGHVYERDKMTGKVTVTNGVGDVRLLLRQNIVNPDGPSKGFSAGVLPYVYLPTGRTPVGDGEVSYGVITPFGFPLSKKVNLSFSPQVQAEVDDDGEGRHVRFGGVSSLQADVLEKLTVALELSEFADHDPGGHYVESLGALELLFKPKDGVQLDMGAVAGLNHESADIRLLTGVAFRF